MAGADVLPELILGTADRIPTNSFDLENSI